MIRSIRLLFLLIPFFLFACPAPKSSNSSANDVVGEGIGNPADEAEDPIYGSIDEIAGENGSNWAGEADGKNFKINFLNKNKPGLIEIRDSDNKELYSTTFEGAEQNGNLLKFNLKWGASSGDVVTLKIIEKGKGLANFNVKNGSLKIENVSMNQVK